jgi:hypothetical protein
MGKRSKAWAGYETYRSSIVSDEITLMWIWWKDLKAETESETNDNTRSGVTKQIPYFPTHKTHQPIGRTGT